MTRQEMEERRMAAAGALLSGVSQAGVARQFAVSRMTVSRWRRTLDTEGHKGLARRKTPGRPAYLRRDLLADFLRRWPGGWQSYRNVGESLAEAVLKQFGVVYSAEHIYRTAKTLTLELFPMRRFRRKKTAAAD